MQKLVEKELEIGDNLEDLVVDERKTLNWTSKK